MLVTFGVEDRKFATIESSDNTVVIRKNVTVLAMMITIAAAQMVTNIADFAGQIIHD